MNTHNHPISHPLRHRLAALSLALFLATSAGVHAGTIVVTSTADSGPGSLREALASSADGDTIDATGVAGTILLTSGQLVVSNSVTILGPGPATLSVDGNAATRVFFVQGGVSATISSLTITNGFANDFDHGGSGGGIFNDHSTLTVSNCTVSGNSASGLISGGGIYNDGEIPGSATLSIIASTFSRNSGDFEGGGIHNDGFVGSATLSVSTSTFSDNSAASMAGGGIYNDGESGSATLTLSASTFSGNSAPSGGGIFNVNGATLEIGDTILKAGSGENIVNSSGAVTSRGYNLSSDAAGGDGTTGPGGFLNATGDIRNTDPMLGPLQDNGGPTFTHALLCLSPAIDQGKRNAIPALAMNTDQRGFPRPVDFASIPNAQGGDGSDIGAFELQTLCPADLLLSLGADKTSVKQGDQLTYTITVQNFGPGDASSVVVNDTLSSGTTFVSAQANVGRFTTPPAGQTGVVTWYLGNLANATQQGAQIKVTVIVRGKTAITNTATVSSATADPNLANNTASITTTVASGSGGKKK